MASIGLSRRYTVLMAAALAVFVGWSIAWFVIATYVDRHVERTQLRLAERDLDLECAQRKVTGFPFRIEIRCAHGTHLASNTGHAKVEGATVAALIYRPTRLIIELSGPLSVQSPFWDGLTMDWGLARASARMDLEAGAMTRLDSEFTDLTVAYADVPGADVGEVDINLRHHPVELADLQFSLSLAGFSPRLEALSQAVPAADVRITGVLHDGAVLTEAGGIGRYLADGRDGYSLAIDRAVVEIEGAQIAAEADILVDRDGYLNGRLDLALAGFESGAPFLRSSDGGDVAMEALTRAIAVAPAGTVAGVEGRTVQLTLRRGQVMMGILPLPIRLPPISLSQLRG